MYANNKFVVIISLMTFILLSTHHDQFFFIKNDDISAVNYHPPFPSVNKTAFKRVISLFQTATGIQCL